MASPVPKHLREDSEYGLIRAKVRQHVLDVFPDVKNGVPYVGGKEHSAKFAQGLPTELMRFAGTRDIGDPMCGTGYLAREVRLPVFLNDINQTMGNFLEPLRQDGCEITYVSADKIEWTCGCCLFSPPYYPRTDRRRPNAHDDSKRGPVVGFRDSYDCCHENFIGNPGGANAILDYRKQMTAVYSHLTKVCDRMVVVTKNWTRLGVELRLDLDTILMAESVGWVCTERHGWMPKPSLWARYNAARGGGVSIEDILVFDRV